jgi:hypothetical protein
LAGTSLELSRRVDQACCVKKEKAGAATVSLRLRPEIS